MEKRILCLIIVLFVFNVYAYEMPIPSPGHGGDEVEIFVNGQTMTIQEAIDDGSMAGVLGGFVGSVSGRHGANNIFVLVGNQQYSLQTAFNSALFLRTDSFMSRTSDYDLNGLLGHLANTIWVEVNGAEKTLQGAIDDGDFYSGYSWEIGVWSSCTTCGVRGTKTRRVQCKTGDGTVISDTICCNSPGVFSASCPAESIPLKQDNCNDECPEWTCGLWKRQSSESWKCYTFDLEGNMVGSLEHWKCIEDFIRPHCNELCNSEGYVYEPLYKSKLGNDFYTAPDGDIFTSWTAWACVE